MDIQEILKQQAEYTQNSDVTVEINKAMGWVTIIADKDSQVFLEGEDADEFLAKCDEYSQDCQDMTMEVIQLAVAYDYLDILL